jgi:hypothetical protein
MQSTRVEIHRQAHILIAPVSRLIRCRCSFKSVRLFNQARVVKQYRFAVVGDEWQTDIGPPKAITADIHPIATRRSEFGVDPWAFEFSLCNDLLPFAAPRALGLGQRSLRFDAVCKFWS